MKSLLIFLFYTPFIVKAQSDFLHSDMTHSGIHFVQGLSWRQLLEKAKEENKYIFLDCYASWCGPCKWMAKNIFPQAEVGDYYNAHFLSVCIQMDQTAKDDEAIKSWYTDASTIAKKYGIDAYPTFLYLDPDGHAVHRVFGATTNGKEFIAKGMEAFDPVKQYYAVADNWKNHKNDSAWLYNEYMRAARIEDNRYMIDIGEAFLETQHSLLTYNNILITASLLWIRNSTSSKEFSFFINNVAGINEVMRDSEYVAYTLLSSDVLDKEEIAPLFEKREFPLDWTMIANKIKLKYPSLGDIFIKWMGFQFRSHVESEVRLLADFNDKAQQANWETVSKMIKNEIHGFEVDQLLLENEAKYYYARQNWSKCADVSFILMKKFGAQLGPRNINNISWTYIFQHSQNRKMLKESIKWMKYYIDLDSTKQENFDTYANLIYKIGHTGKALIWEKKAIGLAEKNPESPEDLEDLKIFQSTLDKMEKGLPTW